MAIHAKGGESISPKQKDRTTTNFKNVVFQLCIKRKVVFNWYLICDTISNWYTLFKINIKTLLNTKRRILSRGSLVLVKGKSISNRGRKCQILKMLLKILFIYLWLFAKDFEKNFQNLCKNKTCGASVVQNNENKEIIHAYLMRIYIGSILSNLCTYNYAN